MNEQQVDYYRVLGVPRTIAAHGLKQRYQLLAKQHHPDRGGDTATMMRINQAYQVLSNPSSRAEYDRLHRAEPVPAQPRPPQPRPSTQPEQRPFTRAYRTAQQPVSQKRRFSRFLGYVLLGSLPILLLLVFYVAEGILVSPSQAAQASSDSTSNTPSTTTQTPTPQTADTPSASSTDSSTTNYDSTADSTNPSSTDQQTTPTPPTHRRKHPIDF